MMQLDDEQVNYIQSQAMGAIGMSKISKFDISALNRGEGHIFGGCLEAGHDTRCPNPKSNMSQHESR